MKKTIVCFTFAALLFALSSSAQAQQATKVPRIGYLQGGSIAASTHRIEAFRQGLRDLGYVEGKTSPLNGAIKKGHISPYAIVYQFSRQS